MHDFKGLAFYGPFVIHQPTLLLHSAIIQVMEIWIVKLLREEYKIRLIFGQKSTNSKRKFCTNFVHILVIDLVTSCLKAVMPLAGGQGGL